MMSDNPEINRLKALRSYQIMNTAPERQFDSLTRLIAYICHTPVAAVTFIDHEKLWIKAKIGLSASEALREKTICQYTIKDDQILEIEDLHEDPRFCNESFVENGKRLSFYAGAPLITSEGYRLGALCVLDYKKHRLNPAQREALRTLADEVIALLEVRKKNAELKRMLDQAEQYKNLFNNSSELHCMTDAEGRIEFINDSVVHLLGYTPAEVVGKTVWDFCIPGERERLMPGITEKISQGQNRFVIDTEILTKSGERRWFEWSDVIMKDQWLINGRDVTERKEAERKLQDLSVAVKKSPAGVIMRGARNEVIWMNEAAEKIIGFSLPELQGKIFGDLLIGEKSDPAAVEHAKQSLKDKKSYEIEVVIYRKDRTPIWVFISNNPLFDQDGNLQSQVGIVVDITVRKLAEQQLIKTRQEAIDLSKSKEMFLSVMSHEMRTPLSSVIGTTRLLKEENPLPRQRKNLDILEFSAGNLLSLINNVLDFTKIETGNMMLESVPVNLHELVLRIADSLQFKAHSEKVKIESDTDPSIPSLLMGDPTRLYQVMMNLMGNSLKFTREGFVKLSLSLVDADDTSASVLFQVSDTGIGIAPEKIHTIFDAYSQAETHTARIYGGTGLGLAITKKLLELHHSKIEVESFPGKGSVFRFVIHFEKTKSRPIKEDIEIPYGDPIDAEVLVVDDDSMNRLLTVKILSKWGIRTDAAVNGLEAVHKARDKNYDAILMDIHLPILDGFEASKMIRKLKGDHFDTLPIIALSGSSDIKEEETILASGMNEFVLKPFDPRELYRKLRKVLAS